MQYASSYKRRLDDYQAQENHIQYYYLHEFVRLHQA